MSRKIQSIVISSLMVLVLSACSQEKAPIGENMNYTEEEASTWQEQYDLGMHYLDEGDYEAAIVAFTAAIEIDPNQAVLYLERGNAYIRDGETEDNLTMALTAYQQAVDLDSAMAEAYLGIADVYTAQKHYDKLREILEQGVNATGDNRLRSQLDSLDETRETNIVDNIVKSFDFQAQIVAEGLDVNAENLAVRAMDSRTAAITISGINLNDTYLVDLASSIKDMTEYAWEVYIINQQNTYSVSTAHWAFEPGDEKEMDLADMQHSVWMFDGNSFACIGDAQMTYTPDSITWDFTVPEEYPFDFSNVERYVVRVYDISQNLSIARNYIME